VAEPVFHRGVLLRRLQENGHSPEPFIAAGQLAFIDARALLRELIKDDMPDRDLFKEKVGGMIQKARAGTKNLKIRIYGLTEPVI